MIDSHKYMTGDTWIYSDMSIQDNNSTQLHMQPVIKQHFGPSRLSPYLYFFSSSFTFLLRSKCRNICYTGVTSHTLHKGVMSQSHYKTCHKSQYHMVVWESSAQTKQHLYKQYHKWLLTLFVIELEIVSTEQSLISRVKMCNKRCC